MNSSDPYKPKLLVLLSRFPYPLEKGDKLRAFHQIKELSKEFDITLFALSDTYVGKDQIRELEPYCSDIQVHHIKLFTRTINLFLGLFSELPFQVKYFYSLKAKKRVKVLLEEKGFDHLMCQLIRTSEYIKNIHNTPKTIDYMDALSAGIIRRVDRQPFYLKWLFRIEAKRLKKYEQSVFDFFENQVIISDQDRQLIAHPDKDKITCIANGIDKSYFEEMDRSEEFDLIFVGNMSYPPNIDAVHYIVNEILPELPDSKLLVSGATPHPSVLKLANENENIVITGWVDDIRTSYLRGKIFLAPMLIGTGMQNKLLEAMALKTPCITTSLANNAIKADHMNQIVVADTKEDILNRIKELLTDEELRLKIARSAQGFVEEHYTWEQACTQLIQLMKQKS